MFNYLFDWNDVLWDRVLRDRNFLFSPVHISVKLMQWWLSPLPNKLSFKKGAEKIFPDKRHGFLLPRMMMTVAIIWITTNYT